MRPPFRDHWLVLEKLLVLNVWLLSELHRHTNVEQVVAVGYYKGVLIAILVDKGDLALFARLRSVKMTMQQRG
jgi:hypothetical protein